MKKFDFQKSGEGMKARYRNDTHLAFVACYDFFEFGKVFPDGRFLSLFLSIPWAGMSVYGYQNGDG